MSRTLTARWRRRITHTSLTVAALTMTASLLAPIATADQVTQDDIDKSKDQEQTTSTSIADLEVQISQLSADRDTAQISAQSANEDYLQALDELDTATTEAKTAEQNAVDAAAATETARSGLGSVVVATYQEAGNPLDFLTPFLTSDSLADLTEARVVLTRAGESSIIEVQNVEALQAVADTMKEIANDKVVEKKTASAEAEKTKTDAETAAQNAVKAVTEAEDRRADLISQLAQQRNTTVELETQYQDRLEADRRAREEAAAREALQQQRTAAAQSSADQQPTAQPSAPATPSAEPSATAQPAPEPTPESQPAPTAAAEPPEEPDPAEPPPLPQLLPAPPPGVALASASGASSAWTAWLRPLPVGLTLIVTVPGRPPYCSMALFMVLTVICPTAMTKAMVATAAATPTRDSRIRSLPMRSWAQASTMAPKNPVRMLFMRLLHEWPGRSGRGRSEGRPPRRTPPGCRPACG